MKKYLQYNATQYAQKASETHERRLPTPTDAHQNGGPGMALDLSGKILPGGPAGGALATPPQWDTEQEAALDLSSNKKPVLDEVAQSEALDLSKPSNGLFTSSPRPNQPFPQSKSPHPALGLPPMTSKHATATHCSLLQAALNSSQSTAPIQSGYLPSSQSLMTLDGRQRAFNGGIGILDSVRSIKPFSSLATRPVGISVPHITGMHASVAVVQGIHKPMAITAPQPHVTVTSSKDHQVSQSPSSFSQSNGRGTGPTYKINKSPCNSPPFQNHMISLQGGPQQNGLKSVQFVKGHDGIANQFLMQIQASRNHIMNGPNINPPERAGFCCVQCPKSFKTKAALKLHTTVHKTSEERQYECLICKRRFLHRHHLVVHQRKHSGDKPFKCNACSKTFMAIFLLHKHLRKHVRETGQTRDISVEQLQQLHIKKMTSDGPSDIGTIGNVSGVPEPSLVVLSDEEESSLSSSIKHSIDNSTPDKGSEVKQNGQPITECAEKIIELNKSETVVSKPDRDSDMQETSKGDQRKIAITNVDTTVQENTPIKCSIIPGEKRNDNYKMLENTISVETEKKTSNKEDVINSVPICGEGEELELDFITGELKVVPKRIVEEDESFVCSDASEFMDSETKDRSDICCMPNGKIDHFDTSERKIKEDDAKDGSKLSEVDIANTSCLTSEEQSCKDAVNKVKLETMFYSLQSSKDHDTNSDHNLENVTNKRQSSSGFDNDEEVELKKAKFKADDESHVYIETADDTLLSYSEEQLKCSNVVTSKAGKTKSRKGKRAKCEICSRTFSSNHHLVLHMSVHKRNPTSNGQNMTKAKNSTIKPPVYTKTNINCKVCKKVFKFQKSLNSHMRVHSKKLAEQRRLSKAFRDFVTEVVPPVGGNSHSCDKDSALHKEESQGDSNCDQETEQIRYAAAVHPVAHSGHSPSGFSIDSSDKDPPIQFIIGEDNVKRYVCHACDNTYTTKQKLKMHALIHKDNCYLCDMCGKSFFREVTLEKHITTHLLPRPHVCTVCKKSFIHRSSLMRHRSVHTGISNQSLKQQQADIKFEMKMLDTYTLLRQERLQQMQGVTKMQPSSLDSLSLPPKNDVLDLSVRVKTDEAYSSLPPVLSPVQKNESQIPNTSSCADLSPPLITCESVAGKGKITTHLSPGKSSTPASVLNVDLSHTLGNESNVKMPILVESNITQAFPKEQNKDNETPLLKKSRKTRVYQTSCRECKQLFPNVMSLKTHMVVHNMIETHLYECHICHHRFTQSCSLLRHLKTSCQENRLKCDPCGKTFHRRNTFEQHLKLHQVGTASLDGSFYDKRRDEAELKEERESDIENNNINKVKQELSVKLETPSIETNDMHFAADVAKTNNAVYEHLLSIPYQEKEKFDNETESDARTYLYSEGEIRTRDLSDFSDDENTPSSSPHRKSVPKTESPTPMTLNLLSAVCSDIRNAEKENEMRRKELEERQKELETIEILANLKRGLLQSQSPSDTTQKPDKEDATKYTSSSTASVKISKVVHSPPKPNSATATSESSKTFVTMSKPPTSVPIHVINSFAVARIHSPLELKPATTTNSQKSIPTVALEAAAEAEAAKETLKAIRAPKSEPNRLPDPLSIYEMNHLIFRDLQRYSGIDAASIREKLSLLMKAQIPAPRSPNSAASSTTTGTLKPSTPLQSPLSREEPAKMSPHAVATTAQVRTTASFVKSRIDSDNAPQDLSMKKTVNLLEKHPAQSLPIPVSLRERSLPSDTPLSPPPLVPVFNCDQCGMLLYNKNALFLHVQEHEFAKNPSLLKIPPRDILPSSYPEVLKREPKSEHIVVPVSAAHSSAPSAGTIKKEPPTTLDLTSERSQATKVQSLKGVLSSTKELSSPTTSSTEQSDGQSSPGTPSVLTAPTDLIRKELRCKIYSRRRSQGLEDLMVEFKSPEPSEMTEEEKLKLNYRRECNRQAAQRSRMRKKDLVDSLLEELHKEEITQSDLRRKVESLSVEKKSLLKVLDSHTCVRDGREKSENSDSKTETSKVL